MIIASWCSGSERIFMVIVVCSSLHNDIFFNKTIKIIKIKFQDLNRGPLN